MRSGIWGRWVRGSEGGGCEGICAWVSFVVGGWDEVAKEAQSN